MSTSTTYTVKAVGLDGKDQTHVVRDFFSHMVSRSAEEGLDNLLKNLKEQGVKVTEVAKSVVQANPQNTSSSAPKFYTHV